MKISLDIKKELKEYYIELLEKKGFKIEKNTSFGNIWVYDLSHIDYSKNCIELNQQGSMQYIVILLEDIDYFEIQNQ